MKNFLHIENKKLFKCFLDFLLEDFSNQKYNGLDNYIFYDVYDESDEKIADFRRIYYNFINQNEEQNSNMIMRYRKKVSKGALYFIGVINRLIYIYLHNLFTIKDFCMGL